VITTTITENPAETVNAVVGVATAVIIKMYERHHPYNLKMSHNFAIKPGKLLKLRGAAAKDLPAVVDLRLKFQAPYDQGALGSCTANALCGVVGYLDPKMLGSRLFLYYNERVMEGTVGEDSGAFLEDGVKSLETYGICPETMWGYDVSKFTVRPHDDCYKEALDHQVLHAKQIYNDLHTMRSALSEGHPFVVGIMIYESFESAGVAQHGMVPMPAVAAGEQTLGGHAVCCVGYNDVKKVWIMRNSWGSGWGDGGYFYLPYDYLLDSSLATDLWTIIKMEADDGVIVGVDTPATDV
jgi:C1A family cysteine protease